MIAILTILIIIIISTIVLNMCLNYASVNYGINDIEVLVSLS